MFSQITNLDGILHMPTCCECKQEISPTVDPRLGARIPILRIRIRRGGPICVTDSQCTLVMSEYSWNMLLKNATFSARFLTILDCYYRVIPMKSGIRVQKRINKNATYAALLGACWDNN